jgi:outer membrane receptor for monomeric catechols
MSEQRDEQTPLLSSTSSIHSAQNISISSSDAESSDTESNIAVVLGQPDDENAAASVADNQQAKPTLNTTSLVQVIAVLAIGKQCAIKILHSTKKCSCLQ